MFLDILTGQTLGMLAMDFAIVFVVLLLVRTLYGVASGVDTMHELAVKDNTAVGVSLAGATAGIAIMLTGVVSGGFALSFGAEAGAMAAYGALGLALMWLTRLIFDKISLPNLSVKDEISGGNVPIAVVDAGNVLATAIMVRAVIDWSDDALVAGLIAVVVGYLVTQVVLTATTYYRVWLFQRRNPGKQFDDTVKGGNVALALRFVGFQLGVALAVTTASALAPYVPGGDPVIQALTWGAWSVGAAVVLVALSLLAEKVVLKGIDLAEEVDRQGNVGIALIEVAVYVGIGLLLLNHLG